MTPIEPKFAVLVCTHNGCAHLAVQLESLARQTWPPAAIFIHDWASNDDTLRIAREFQAISPVPVTVVGHDAAPGPRESFARGIASCLDADASFTHLLLSDQDDVWRPQKIERYAGILRAAGAEAPTLIYSDVRLVDEAGRVRANSFYDGTTPFAPPRRLDHASILLTNPVIGMTLCLQRQFLTAATGALDAPWLMHDWALVLLALSRGARIAFVTEPLVDYRQHASNVIGAGSGWRLRRRLSKARAHFAALRAQMAVLQSMQADAWSASARRLMRPGPAQRIRACAAALRSPVLRPTYRAALAVSTLLFW